MIKPIFFLLLLSLSINTNAERIHGPANIREKPNGELLFSLIDNLEIETHEPTGDWYEVLIFIRLTEEEYATKELIFKKGTNLYDQDGTVIGVTLKDLTINGRSTWGGAPGNPKKYQSELMGFTHKSNIRKESIVEPEISLILENNKGHLTKEKFTAHLTSFGYVDGLGVKDMPQLTTYMVYESVIDDPSPLDRIRLIFDKDDLIAVVHSRQLTITGFETVPIERGRKLTLIKAFSNQEKLRFIERNKQSYWGID